ncbi:hypothetical protein FRC11_000910, partial [Ceratobasidium sp. 423]
MTPQASRPNFGRVPIGRKSVALGVETGEAGDISWLPSRVPASTQEVDSEEEESHESPEDPIVEDVPMILSDLKQMPELDAEEKAARRQSALAVLAAGPRQLPTRRQSVAAHLVKSEPLDPNDRRMTLADAALGAPAGTPQHASALAKASDYQVVIDSSDEEEEPAESALSTLRKKVDYMRRQSMSRAAREKPIGPLFGETDSGDVKLEDSEELGAAAESEDIKQELEEAEQELEELEDEAETEAELSVDEGDGDDVSDAEDDASEHEALEAEHDDAHEQSDVEAEQQPVDEPEEEEIIPADAKMPVMLPTGPSTPALKGIRALFRAEEVKGLGTQTPAGLDGMLQLFGPEAEHEAELAVDEKPSRLRTKSADPTRSKIATSTMTRAKSSQATTLKAPEVARTRSADTRVKADATKGASATSRIASRTLREPSKLPPRVHTPTEEPEALSTRTSTRKAAPAATFAVVLPRRTKAVKTEPEAEVKEEPAPTASKLKAPTKRVTRTASAPSHTTENTKPITRTASSTGIEDKPATRRGRVASATQEETKPATRTTRAKATAPTRRKDASSSARPTTPTESVDDNDPMDAIPMPESPTKRSTRAKATTVKSEPEDDEPIPATRSRTRTAESDNSKGKRTVVKRVASKDIDDNKENAAVDGPEAETEQAKTSGIPTKATRK